MATSTRSYVNTARRTTLAHPGGLTVSQAEIVADDSSGYPTSHPFIITLDRGTDSEEILMVDSGSGTPGDPWVVVRGYDGTTAKTHVFGATIEHTDAAVDFREFGEHINSEAADLPHGLPADVWTLPASLADLQSQIDAFIDSLNELVPVDADKVRYVSPRGDDTNDGLAVNKAKKTLAAASTALASAGEIRLGAGTTTLASSWDLSSRTNVRITGMGGVSGGATPASIISFTGTGSGIGINLKNSQGCSIDNIMVLHTSASFTGSLIAISAPTGSAPAYWEVRRCYLGSSGAITTAAALLDLDVSQDGSILGCHFQGAINAIKGSGTSGLCNGIVVQGCVFHNSSDAHIKNISEGWQITGNVFEALSTGRAGAIKNDSAVLVKGVLIAGNWLGDVTAGGGTQIDLGGRGINIIGNSMGFNNNTIAINIQALSEAIQITGNGFQGGGTGDTGIVIGANCKGYVLEPNYYQSVATPVSGAVGLTYLARSTSAPWFYLHNTSSADGRSVIAFQADRSSTKLYHLGLDPDGGTGKFFGLRDITRGAYPWKVTSAGSHVFGDASLSTSATDGFVYIPKTTAKPTGTPTAQTGTAPLVLDGATRVLYADGWFPVSSTLSTVSKTTTYTPVDSDHIIFCSTSGGIWTLTLPTAVGRAGKSFIIIKTDSTTNALTLATTSGETISGFASGVLTLDLIADAIEVVSDGANWWVARDKRRRLRTPQDGTGVFEWRSNGGTVDLSINSTSTRVGVATGSPAATLHVAGPIITALAGKTGNYTVTSSDSVIGVDATSGSVTITLPTAGGGITGRQHFFYRSDDSSNNVTIVPNGSETINGRSSRSLGKSGDSVMIVSDGTNWRTLGSSPNSRVETLDYASIPALTSSELTISVPGAIVGQAVWVGAPSGLEADLIISACWVSAADTVKIRLYNPTASAIDPASASWTVRVW